MSFTGANEMPLEDVDSNYRGVFQQLAKKVLSMSYLLSGPIMYAVLLCQNRSIELFPLSIVASVADTLRRLNEQNEANLRYRTSRFKTLFPLFTNRPKLELIPATELLIQVQDVLVVLRKLSQLGLALIYIWDLAYLTAFITLALTATGDNDNVMAIYCGLCSIWMMLKQQAVRERWGRVS